MVYYREIDDVGYHSEVEYTSKNPLSDQAGRLLDAWPECTGVRVEVSVYRKVTTPQILALDVGFKDGTRLPSDDCWVRVQPGERVQVKLATLIDKLLALGCGGRVDDSED